MTVTTPEAPPAKAASIEPASEQGPAATPLTEPLPPAAAPTPFVPQAPPNGSASQPPMPPYPPVRRTPWYRRAWVLAVGAALLALLSFGSGFVAGSAASLVRAVNGSVPSFEERGFPGGPGPGPGFGDRDGDGFGGFGDRDGEEDGGTDDDSSRN